MKYELTDKRGSKLDLRLSINIHLTWESPAEFIKSLENASHLEGVRPSETEQAPDGLGLQIFQILQQIVPVSDEIADVSMRYFSEWPRINTGTIAAGASSTENDLDDSIIRL